MKGISVGDKVYLYVESSIRNEKSRLGEAVVTRVGRKYVYCKDTEKQGQIRLFMETRFCKDEYDMPRYGNCMTAIDDYNRRILMFATEKERDESIERIKLFETIKRFLGGVRIGEPGLWFSPSLYSIEQAREIAEILGIRKEDTV